MGKVRSPRKTVRAIRRAALVLGGCCELNSTAHGLIVEIGTQLGQLMATDSGNGPSECVALEIHRLRQRGVAIRIWSSYQDHVSARTQYANPTPDTRRQHTREAIRTAEEREQAAQLAVQRHTNELYMLRQGRPATLGV